MSISSKASKLLTNKYVLYVVLFLAVTTVFGYMSMNDTNSVILFALICLVSSLFTKNMIVILGLSIVFTNLLVVTKGNSFNYKEGLENKESNKINESNEKTNTNMNTNTNANTNTNENTNTNANATANTNTNIKTEESMDTMKLESSNKKGGKNRIDYASTLEDAYDNLDSILGGEGIKQLTNDTQKLMSKQQELFKSMETMAPMLSQAKSMLEGFDMKNLQGLASLATNFSSTPENSKDKK